MKLKIFVLVTYGTKDRSVLDTEGKINSEKFGWDQLTLIWQAWLKKKEVPAL